MTRLQVRLDLGILDLKHEAQLARCRVSLLDDLVAGTSNFDRSPRENLRHRRGRGAKRLVLLLVQRLCWSEKGAITTSSRQIRLMTSSLCVGEEIGLCVVHRQTQLALKLAKMVSQ